MAKTRTATETLIAVMEDFGVSEPKDCIVIYPNEAGDLCWSSTTDSYHVKFGLVEACKQALINQYRKLE